MIGQGKRINFVIKPGGSVELDAVGYQGRECLDATKAFEDLLRGGPIDRKIKPEMQEKTVQHVARQTNS